MIAFSIASRIGENGPASRRSPTRAAPARTAPAASPAGPCPLLAHRVCASPPFETSSRCRHKTRPPELLQVIPQQPHVLFGRIVPHKTSEQSAGGVVDHRDQIQLLSSPLQPVVLAGVPLALRPVVSESLLYQARLRSHLRPVCWHQLSQPVPPRPPELAANHPFPYGLLASLDPVFPSQVFRRPMWGRILRTRAPTRSPPLAVRCSHRSCDWTASRAARGPLPCRHFFSTQSNRFTCRMLNPNFSADCPLRDQSLLGVLQRHQPVSIGLLHQ